MNIIYFNCSKLVHKSLYVAIFQVQRLLALCPRESASGIYRLDHRGQEAIIAIGIYYLESDLQVIAVLHDLMCDT